MSHTINDNLKALEDLDTVQLRERWAEVFKAPPPKSASQDLMMRAIAQHIQEDHYGGLKAATKRRLKQLAKTLRDAPDAALAPAPMAKPGTTLVREWQGRKHQVTVLDTGFAYDGKVYDSLSKIARLITGTRWSGPVFFGLKPLPAKARAA